MFILASIVKRCLLGGQKCATAFDCTIYTVHGQLSCKLSIHHIDATVQVKMKCFFH